MTDKLKYEYKPLPKHQLDAFKKETPKIYDEMVSKYGEENVKNHIVAEFTVLTEGRNILGMDRKPFDLTKEDIIKTAKVNNTHFMDYLKHPASTVKSWIRSAMGDEDDPMSDIGFAPLILDHKIDHVEGRQGYVIGNSYKAVNVDGVHLLICKCMILNPKGKWNYINGIYREVSPTIQLPRPPDYIPKVPYKITELSFVNIPAQLTNTSMSAGENDDVVHVNEIVEPVNINWEAKIAQAFKDVQIEKENNQIKQKNHTAKVYTESLIKNKVIPSSMREYVKNTFTQLSSGQEALVYDLMKKGIKNSLFVNKPRTFLLKGTIDMNLSKDERWLRFAAENRSKFPTEADLRNEFDKAEAKTSVSLSDGEAMLIDPMRLITEMMDKLESLHKQGVLTDEHRKMLSKYCGKTEETSMEDGSDGSDDVSMAADSAAGDGKPTNGGGLETPNNTSLSAPQESGEAQINLVEVLQAGFNAEKAAKEKAESELEALKAKFMTIQNTLK